MPTEIEAKYIVPDRESFRALRALTQIAGYALAPGGKVKVVDRYLDTRGRALTRQGWACRLRAVDKTWVVTLKGPRSVHGAVMSREELEITLAEPTTRPTHWPEGPLRDRVERLTGGSALRELLTIRQKRYRSLAQREGAPVVEIALDVVRVDGDGATSVSHMVECELLAEGVAADLERLDEALRGEYGLIPEPRTKLQRALEFVETGLSPDDALLAGRAGAAAPEPATPEELVARHNLDAARAHHVAEVAEALFTGLAPVHALPPEALRTVRAAAMLIDLGAETSRAYRHVVARDLMLRQPVADLGAEAQQDVAVALYLHRKRITPERLEAAFPAPPSDDARRTALAVAVLVRLAAALDASHSQSTRIVDAAVEGEQARITVAGPRAERDLRGARRRSDLWDEVFATPIVWREAPAVAPPQVAASGATDVQPDDSIQAATHKILSRHWGRVLAHREGTRAGVDPEELHDMRVATRRLRSAARLLKSYLQTEHLAPAVQGLREAALFLGQVRDLDVSLARARAFEEERDGEGERLAPLIDALEARRRGAREEMLAYLDGARFRRLAAEMESLLVELRAAAAQPAEESNRVRSVAPRLLHIRWEGVRAYGAVLAEAPIGLLHALRIECKHLRYALEFLRAALPRPVNAVIERVVALQDHLGDLHDADVSVHMLDRFLAERGAAGHDMVAAYRAARQAERQRLIETFPEAWGRLVDPETEHAMAYVLTGIASQAYDNRSSRADERA